MITKLQITGKLHYHRKCDFQLSKRKLGYKTLLPITAPIVASTCNNTVDNDYQCHVVFRLLVDAVTHVFSVFRVCKVP